MSLCVLLCTYTMYVQVSPIINDPARTCAISPCYGAHDTHTYTEALVLIHLIKIVFNYRAVIIFIFKCVPFAMSLTVHTYIHTARRVHSTKLSLH